MCSASLDYGIFLDAWDNSPLKNALHLGPLKAHAAHLYPSLWLPTLFCFFFPLFPSLLYSINTLHIGVDPTTASSIAGFSLVRKTSTLKIFCNFISTLAMANVRCNCLFFLLILILSRELLFTEGRSLELKKNIESAKLLSPDGKSIHARPAGKNVANPSPLHHVFSSLEENVDAFRPTTPGHSPGVGH